MTYKQLLALLAEKSKFGDFETQGLYKGLHGFFSGAKRQFGLQTQLREQLEPPTSYQGMSFEDYGSGGWQTMTPEERITWEQESGYNNWAKRSPYPIQQYPIQQPYTKPISGPYTPGPVTQPKDLSGYVGLSQQQPYQLPSEQDRIAKYGTADLPQRPRGGPVTQPRDLSGYVGLQQDHPAQLNRLQEQKAQTRNTRLDQFKRRVF